MTTLSNDDSCVITVKVNSLEEATKLQEELSTKGYEAHLDSTVSFLYDEQILELIAAMDSLNIPDQHKDILLLEHLEELLTELFEYNDNSRAEFLKSCVKRLYSNVL